MRKKAIALRQGVLQGVIFVVAATAFFASLDTSTKLLSATVPVMLMMWVRFSMQALSTALVMGPRRGRALLRTHRPGLQLLRGVLMIASSMLAFFSLQVLPVENFTAIVMLTPLVVTITAALRLREAISALRWILLLGGFVGVLLVIRPGADSFAWSSLLPLLLVLVSAAFQLVTSRLAQEDDVATIHFYSGLVSMLLASLTLPFFWQDLPLWPVWALMLLVAVFSTMGHLMLVLGYASAPVATLTPYLYAQVPFAMLGSWLVFDHAPDALALLGIAVIAVAGAVGTWVAARERHRDIRVILDA